MVNEITVSHRHHDIHFCFFETCSLLFYLDLFLLIFLFSTLLQEGEVSGKVISSRMKYERSLYFCGPHLLNNLFDNLFQSLKNFQNL